jgi:hypothetical protein
MSEHDPMHKGASSQEDDDLMRPSSLKAQMQDDYADVQDQSTYPGEGYESTTDAGVGTTDTGNTDANVGGTSQGPQPT